MIKGKKGAMSLVGQVTATGTVANKSFSYIIFPQPIFVIN